MNPQMDTMKRILNGASRDAAQSEATPLRDDYAVGDRRDRRRALGLHRLGVATAKTYEQVVLVAERVQQQSEPLSKVDAAIAKLDRLLSQTEALADRLTKIEERQAVERA